MEVQIPPDAQTVQGDADAIAVLLRNLLENAVRHARGRVRIESRVQDGAVQLAVRDDGDGLTAEQAARAFDRFYRAGNGGGSGLGLAIVQRVAQLHGGAARLGAGLDGRGLGVEVTLTQR